MVDDISGEGDVEDADLCCRLMDMLRVGIPREPEDGMRVLRNLTAKEYVIDEVIAKSNYAFSLGQVIVVSSLWSDRSDGLARLGGKGKWAGHRFDIASIRDVAGEGWEDVTSHAMKLLEDGSRWHQTIRRRA